MAIDLQTKLQQTKLKLFGINSSEDEFDLMANANQLNDPTFITSTKHEIVDYNNEESIENMFLDDEWQNLKVCCFFFISYFSFKNPCIINSINDM